MSDNSVKRKLTAILCADVKGYSRMMGEDEVGTFHTLSDFRSNRPQSYTPKHLADKMFQEMGMDYWLTYTQI